MKEPKQLTVNPVAIQHLKSEIHSSDGSIKLLQPTSNTDMREPNESRYCLASMIPDIIDIVSIKLQHVTSNEDNATYIDPLGTSKLYTLMKHLDRDLYGGTGLNQGVFYGINWLQHPFTTTSDAVAYLSLLFTPFSSTQGTPEAYAGKALVVSDAEYEDIGLPAGYGTIITPNDYGQVRILLQNTSIGKGVAVSNNILKQIGVEIPQRYHEYAMIICESDIKINPLTPGEYDMCFGVTNVNPYTIHGQKISLGFEFWQMLNLDSNVLRTLVNAIIQQPLPNYADILLSLEERHKLRAYNNNEPYEPLELNMKLQEALVVLGHQYPWVANKLQAVVANYILGQRFTGTEYRIALVVNDNIKNGYAHTEDGTSTMLAGKYPISAGIMQLKGSGSFGPYAVLKKSTADLFNVDADGDCIFLCNSKKNSVFDMILKKQLVKPVRDISLPKKEKYYLPVTLENIAKTAWQIFTNSSQIGNLTINYYLSEIANDVYGTNLDLHLFYKGIERVIKSAKHRMDLSFLNQIDYNTLNDLKEILEVPFLRSNKKILTRQINNGEYNMDNISDAKINDPAHYMEHIWNATIDRIKIEIAKLKNNVQPLSTFADMIGLSIIDEDLENNLNFEIKQINSIMNLWIGVAKGSLDTKDGIKAISTASTCFSLAALREFMRSYLIKSNSTGGFLIHLCYGRLAEIFSNPLKYNVKTTGTHLVRFYGSEIGNIDYKTAKEFKIIDGLPQIKDTVLLPGDEAGDIDIDTATVISAFPYLNRKGEKTNSVWALIK